MQLRHMAFTCSEFELGDFGGRAITAKDILAKEAVAIEYKPLLDTVVGIATTSSWQVHAEKALKDAGWEPRMCFSGAHNPNDLITIWAKVVKGEER